LAEKPLDNLATLSFRYFLIVFLSYIIFRLGIVLNSVAEPELEPEPVEQQLFAGAGAKVFFTRLRSRVDKFL
jgi:hypothetical protein